jgi:hypothetical protein
MKTAVLVQHGIYVSIASQKDHVVDHGQDIIAEQRNLNIQEFALAAIVGYRNLHLHLPDGINVRVGFGLQDDLFHAAKERRDFVKHCPEKVSV